MVVGCISESTRLDQEWCSKFIHSVETAVAVGSEYQVILHFLAAALEAWLRWFNFVSGSDFIYFSCMEDFINKVVKRKKNKKTNSEFTHLYGNILTNIKLHYSSANSIYYCT